MYEKVLIQRLLAVIRKQQKEIGTELVTPAMVIGAALTVIRTDLPAGTPLKVVKDQENLRSLLQERQPGVEVALTAHEMGLVKALSEHVLDEEEIRVEHGMGAIATVVALAPMLGLLGTVWGVLDAFADMGAAGSATIATMAPAISSALVTTVVGLLVAIPGVMLHTHLNSKARGLMSDMEGFTDDLIGRIALEFQGRNY